MVLFLLLVILTILFPGEIAFYLCGRFSPDALSFIFVLLLYLVVILFMLICFVAGIVRLFVRWGPQTRNEKLLISAEVVVPLIFAGILVSNIFFKDPEFGGRRQKFLMLGLRDLVKSNADIAATRLWLQAFSNKDYDLSYNIYDRIPSDDLPDSLKELKDARPVISVDENGNAKVRLIWGSGMIGHWGAEIGAEDMKIPPSDFSRYGEIRLPLEPGVYVWLEVF